MTPTQLARDALAGQLTPLDALVRIAGMEEVRARSEIDDVFRARLYYPITDEVVERCARIHRDTAVEAFGGIDQKWDDLSDDRREATLVGIRAAIEEFVRQTRPQEVRRATEQDAHAAVYAQTADREAGEVAWGCGEPFDPRKSQAWCNGWLAAKGRI